MGTNSFVRDHIERDQAYIPKKDRVGTFTRNRFKSESKHPSYKGRILIDGVVHDIAIWENKTQSGGVYFTLKLTEAFVKEGGIVSGNPVGGDDSKAEDSKLPF